MYRMEDDLKMLVLHKRASEGLLSEYLLPFNRRAFFFLVLLPIRETFRQQKLRRSYIYKLQNKALEVPLSIGESQRLPDYRRALKLLFSIR